MSVSTWTPIAAAPGIPGRVESERPTIIIDIRPPPRAFMPASARVWLRGFWGFSATGALVSAALDEKTKPRQGSIVD
jgi:hypothetical protein